MAEAATTSINDLPMDPAGGGSISGSNVNVVASEVSLDQSTINQIVSGLQQASLSGATSLPSRDIPRSTEPITQDPYVQPNYIPPASNDRYITEDDAVDQIVNRHQREDDKRRTLDAVYNEIQVPLLLMVMYFLFQLPFFKAFLFKHMPFLLNKDGHWNLHGLVFTSAMYGGIYYAISKLMAQVNGI